MVALFINGAVDMVSVVVRQTLVQLDTPDEMRGRVSAVNSIFIGASNQLGEFESGATAALFGPVGAVVLGGVGTLVVVGLWMRWFPRAAPPQGSLTRGLIIVLDDAHARPALRVALAGDAFADRSRR